MVNLAKTRAVAQARLGMRGTARSSTLEGRWVNTMVLIRPNCRPGQEALVEDIQDIQDYRGMKPWLRIWWRWYELKMI